MQSSANIQSAQALQDLGFTGLEAEVYAALLEHSPVTAYRVAQQVGKAAANVYKAVESLRSKGAVLVDDNGSQLCRPVAPDDLLRQMGAQFEAAMGRAALALAKLGRPGGDERVYQLRSREQ